MPDPIVVTVEESLLKETEGAPRNVSGISNLNSAVAKKTEQISVVEENDTIRSIAEKLKYDKKRNSLHDKVLSRLIKRRNMGAESFKQKVEEWDDIDNFLRGRIDLTRGAALADGGTDYSKREMPYDRAIVVPVSFSILTVRHTQELSTILSRDPVFQVEGASPEDALSARLVEAVLAYDCRQTNIPLAIHQILWDVERYGLGIFYVTFEREYSKAYIRRSRTPREGFLYESAPELFEPEPERVKREYNRVIPINPRRFYPDPRCSLANLQSGEFVGHSWVGGYSQLREMSMENGGPYFNVEEARTVARSSSSVKGGSISKRGYGSGYVDELDPGVFEIYHMQVKIVPKEWGLTSSEEQEIWWFTWVNDSVIVRAHPSPYDHGEFTYCVAEGFPDWHSLDNPGWGELLLGIQRLANWLYNTHVEAVRKALNGALLYSPDFINEIDLLNPHPAGHVRMTKLARDMMLSGRIQNPAQLYGQLYQQDVTRGHVNDVMTLMEFAQRLSGANDPQQGMPLPSRRTLGELQTIMAASSQRIATTARLVDAMALRRLVSQMISNRQQLTEVEQWYRIGGDTAKRIITSGFADGKKIINQEGVVSALIGREDLFGRYDYIGHTASIVSDISRDPETWARVLQFVGNIFPILANPQFYPDGRTIDVRELFTEMARAMGIKDIDRFFMQTAPPQRPPGMPQGPGGPPPAAGLGGGVPPEMLARLQGGGVRVVPDEEYMRRVASGDFVAPEEIGG